MDESRRLERLCYEKDLTSCHLYPKVTKELSLILREAYDRLPKDVQFSIFQLTLTAFRLLPQIETKRAISAAQLLFQSAEATFPKQRRTMAITEFKHAKVTLSRRSKSKSTPEGECTPELPHDVLLHIFSYLDVSSLISVALVCRSWNLASGNNHLWKCHYAVFFGKPHKSLRIKDRQDSSLDESKGCSTSYIYWRKKFQRECTGFPSKRVESFRACCTYCNSIVWLDHPNCLDKNCRVSSLFRRIVPISALSVVSYLIHDSWSTSPYWMTDSDSESEEDEAIPRLWADALTDLMKNIKRE